jgi:CheY-like chemotaxis protein
MSRVLVVDDSATIRRLVRAILEESGHQVETAADGQSALDHLRHGLFDLILLDFVMPRMDGFQLAHAIRANARLHAVPIALMSAKAETIGPRFARQFRGALTLAKPFDPDALSALVSRALALGARSTSSPRALSPRAMAAVTPPAPPRVQGGPGGPARETAGGARAGNSQPTNSNDPSDSRLASRRAGGMGLGSGPVIPIAPGVGDDDAEHTVVAAIPFEIPPERDPREDGTHERDRVGARASAAGGTDSRGVEARSEAIDRPGTTGAPRSPSDAIDAARGRALAPLTDALVALWDHAARGATGPESLADRLARALDDRAIADLLEAARAGLAAIDPTRAATLEGSLAAIPIAELLQMLRLQQQSGVLTVRRGATEVDLCLRDGALEQAVGRGLPREFLLGRYALAARLLDQARLSELLATPGRGRLGAALVAAGVTDSAGLERLLVRQSSELLYELCRWNDGRFVFVQGLSRPEATEAGLGLPVEPLLLEGFRRVDEWGEIERDIPSLHARFTVDRAALEETDPARLSPEERAVIDCIDGERTALEVIDRAHRAAFDVCKTLARLRREGIVRSASP